MTGLFLYKLMMLLVWMLCAVWARQLSKDDEPKHAPQWMPLQR